MKVHIEEGPASPIDRIVRSLCRSLVLIAPERVSQVGELVDALTLIVSDEPRFVCNVEPELKTVRVSRRAMEIVWATSYAYFTFYSEVLAGKLITTKTVVELNSHPLLRDAMALLRWSLMSNAGPWPGNLPAPEEHPVAESNGHVANEIACAVFAFLFHHELAHIRLGHRPTADWIVSVDQERDADYAAADWILGKSPAHALAKRTFGVAVGLVILVGRGIHFGFHDGETHPRTFDRLVFTLERHVADPGDLAWSFAMAVMKLHLDNARISVPEIVFNSPKDAVNAYAEQLSRC